MQGISSLLRQRLRSRPAPEVHPDSDTLSAYVEQVLSSEERSRVVLHLANCSDCREVVALSLPEVEQVQVIHTLPQRSSWLSAFRWVAATATIAVAATLVIERPWQGPSETGPNQTGVVLTPKPAPQVAPQQQTTPPVSPTIAADAAAPSRLSNQSTLGAAAVPLRSSNARSTAPTVAQAPVRLQDNSSAARLRVSEVVEIVAGQPVATEAYYRPNGDRHDYVNTKFFASDQEGDHGHASASGGLVANLPASPAAGTTGGPVSGDSARRRQQVPPIQLGRVIASADALTITPPHTSSATPAPQTDNSLDKMHFATKVRTKITEGFKAMARNGSSRPPAAANSFLGSNAINVSAADAGVEMESVQASQEQFRWGISDDGKLIKSADSTQWHEAYSQSGDLHFSVVVSYGRDVWAGANHATLIHSSNGGMDWQRLKVPDAASGDITAISLDSGYVQVKTAGGQSFVSHDRGMTWVPLRQVRPGNSSQPK
jgi:negative regulator of sigma E activity